MNNEFEFLDSETVKIYLQVKDGQQMFTLITLCDLETVSSIRWRWYAHKVTSNKWYAVAPIRDYKEGKDRRLYMHRFIFGLGPYSTDRRVVDHIQRENTLDNRRSNIRLCTQAENAQNVSLRSNSKSGYRGVVFSKEAGKWEAFSGLDGRKHFLGYYDTPEEAAERAKRFRQENMPYATD